MDANTVVLEQNIPLRPLRHIDETSLLRSLVEFLHEGFDTIVYTLFRAENTGHGIQIVDNLTPASMSLLIRVAKEIGVFGKGSTIWRIEICLKNCFSPRAFITSSLNLHFNGTYLCETGGNRVDAFDRSGISDSDFIWRNTDNRAFNC
jgi:hypothetical protein